MDPDLYVRRMYPMQDAILRRLASLETEFYLTGGTAASRGYLHHWYSDDLDLFVNDDDRFGLWAHRLIQALARSGDWRVEVLQQAPRLARLTATADDVALKIGLVNDVPARVGEITVHPVLGRLDSAENILANKLTAIVDRTEPKDLADIWGFCCLRGLSCEAALGAAQSKAAGLFPVDVARILLTATEQDWQLVRWSEAPNRARFVADLHALGERLLLIR